MTEIFYKATRPDGTDFRTGTVRWLPPVGESIPDDGLIVTHPTVRKKTAGGANSYLSVATIPTNCTGMEWPCRLALVKRTRAAVWTPESSLPNKRASWKWRVVEELDPTLVFGPQGAEIVALIDRSSQLTYMESEAIYNAWVQSGTNEYVEVQEATSYAACKHGLSAARVALKNALINDTRPFDMRPFDDVVTNAAIDAALAIFARDLISEDDFQLLAGPWFNVLRK